MPRPIISAQRRLAALRRKRSFVAIGHLPGELRRRLNFGTGRTSFAGAISHSLPLSNFGSATAGLSGHPRRRRLRRFRRVEHALVRHLALGFLRDDRLPLPRLEHIAPVQEGEHALIVILLVVIDERMIVALGAVQVHAEEEPGDVAREEIGVAIAVEGELGGGAKLGIGAVRGEHLAHQLIPGAIAREGIAEVFFPLGRAGRAGRRGVP